MELAHDKLNFQLNVQKEVRGGVEEGGSILFRDHLSVLYQH